MLHSLAFLLVIAIRSLFWALWILLQFVSVLVLLAILTAAFLTFAFGLWMLIHALIRQRSGADKLGWAVVIVAVPLVGALIYFFLRFLRSSAPPATS